MKHRLLTAFYDTPWAIIPERLPVIRAVLHRWADGIKLSDEEIQAAVGDAPEAAAQRRAQSAPRGIAVLPILGILAQRTAGSVSDPGTAPDRVRGQFAAFMDHPDVDAIVLDIDSPGGSVFGIQELAGDIFAARGRKKVIAVANSQSASAAYWIGSAADEFVMTTGGTVGSIGVMAAHEDHSAALEAKGVKVELISAGKYKTEGHPFGPLSEEGRAAIQARIDEYYDAFVSAVARHRDVAKGDVINGFGEGRTVTAAQAVKENMVDRIETFDAVIDRLMTRPRALAPKRRAGTQRALANQIEVEGRAILTR
jgi:signal peptide peptidase SppA